MLRRELITGSAALAIFAGLDRVEAQVRWKGRSRPAGAAALNLVVHGDSFVANVGASPPPISIGQLCSTQIDNQYDWPNSNTGTALGYSGDGFIYVYLPGSHNYNFVQDVTPFVVPQLSGSLPNWVVNVNDCNDCAIGGQTPAASYSAFQTYCADLITAGVSASNIVISCACSRQSFSDATRATWNALLVGDSGSIGYKVARIDQEPLLNTAAAWQNTTYFQSDGIHLTDAGYQLIAGLVARAMFG